MKLFRSGENNNKSTSTSNNYHPLVGTPYQGSIVKKVKEKQEEKPNGRIKISQEIHLQNGCIFLEAKWLDRDQLYPPPSPQMQQRPRVTAPAPASATFPRRRGQSPIRHKPPSPRKSQDPQGNQSLSTITSDGNGPKTLMDPSVGTASTGYDSSSSNRSLPLEKKVAASTNSTTDDDVILKPDVLKSTPETSTETKPFSRHTKVQKEMVQDPEVQSLVVQEKIKNAAKKLEGSSAIASANTVDDNSCQKTETEEENPPPPKASPKRSKSKTRSKSTTKKSTKNHTAGNELSTKVSSSLSSSTSEGYDDMTKERKHSPQKPMKENGKQFPKGNETGHKSPKKSKTKSLTKSPAKTSKKRKPVEGLKSPPLSPVNNPLSVDNDASFSSLVAYSEAHSGLDAEPALPRKKYEEPRFNGHQSMTTLETKKPSIPDSSMEKMKHASMSKIGLDKSSYRSNAEPKAPLSSSKQKERRAPSTNVAPSRNVSMGDSQPLISTREKPKDLTSPVFEVDDPLDDEDVESQGGSKVADASEGTDYSEDIFAVLQESQKSFLDISVNRDHNANESKRSILSASVVSIQSSASESMSPLSPGKKKKKSTPSKKESLKSSKARSGSKDAETKITKSQHKKKIELPLGANCVDSKKKNQYRLELKSTDEKTVSALDLSVVAVERGNDASVDHSVELPNGRSLMDGKPEKKAYGGNDLMVKQRGSPQKATIDDPDPKTTVVLHEKKEIDDLVFDAKSVMKDSTSERKELRDIEWETSELDKQSKPLSTEKNISIDAEMTTHVASPVKNKISDLELARVAPPQTEANQESGNKHDFAYSPPVTKQGKMLSGKIVMDDVLKKNKITADPHPGFAKIMGIWGERVSKAGGGDGIPFSPLKPADRAQSKPVKLANVRGEKLEDDPRFQLPVFEKTEKEKKMIRQSFEGNFAFLDLMPSEIGPMVDAFEKVEYRKGETIAQRGEKDCFFYIVQEGEVSFDVEGSHVAMGNAGDIFGELALVYSCNRATTVKAEGEASLLRLHQRNYRHIRKHQTARSVSGRMKLLRKVHFFKDADETDLAQLASAMVPRIFKAEEDLTSTFKDSPFCLIEEGSVTSPSDTTVSKGGSFGEENLLEKTAGGVSTVVALTDGIAYTIDRSSFEKVFGDMNRLALKSADKNILRGVRAVRAAGVSGTQLDTLAQQISDHSFTAGQYIFKNNEEMVPALYIVRKGKVKVIRKSGKEDIINAGGNFGQEYLMMSSKGSRDSVPSCVKAKYSAIAIGACVCGILTLQECAAVFGKDGQVDLESSRIIPLEDLERHRLLGEGHFGEVWLVTNSKAPPTRVEPYALKVQYLDDKERQAEKCINEEISIMKMLNYPFVVDLINTYRGEDAISMLLGLAPGGELFDQIHFQLPNGLWDSGIGEDKARFYCAVVADTLSFMHVRGYIYRDLKPENILIDKDGYPLLTDFGFTKRIRRTEKTYTMCGTPNYLPPEIIKNVGHSFSADNWSLGILIYEVAQGENPFYYEGLDQVTVFHAICNEPYYDLPEEMSDEIHDLMDRLLEKHPSKRLGTYREKDILAHPWFDPIDIRKLRKKKVPAPWIPPVIKISK